jgi:hypothetical protein
MSKKEKNGTRIVYFCLSVAIRPFQFAIFVDAGVHLKKVVKVCGHRKKL